MVPHHECTAEKARYRDRPAKGDVGLDSAGRDEEAELVGKAGGDVVVDGGEEVRIAGWCVELRGRWRGVGGEECEEVVRCCHRSALFTTHTTMTAINRP